MDFSLFPYVLDQTSGRIFYVDAGGNWYEWTSEQSNGLSGLSGFWSFLGQIGAAASFAIPGVGPVIGPLASAAIGATQQSAAKGEAAKQLAQQWDQLAGQTTSLYQQIQRQPMITIQDLQTAEAAYLQLETIAQQSGVKWIMDQWNSSAYKPAYLHNLNIIRSRVAEASTGGTGSMPGGGVSDGTSSMPAWVLPVLGVGAAIVLLK